MKASRLAQYAIIAVSLFTLLGIATTAHANQKVRVKNCSGEKMLVCTFDGKDSATVAEADFKRLENGKTTTLKCKGQGKGGCKVKADGRDNSACGERSGKLFSGRHKGYFLLFDDEENSDFVKVPESEYKKADACTIHAP